MSDKTLMERLLDAGYPNEDWHCPTFKDQITGRTMYDCAFQYYFLEAADE